MAGLYAKVNALALPQSIPVLDRRIEYDRIVTFLNGGEICNMWILEKRG
jgi:hypothetical protein